MHTSRADQSKPPTRLPKIACVAAFFRSVAPYDLIESVDCGYFAPLRSLLQRYRGLREGRIADAIDRGAILVNLKAHLILQFILFSKHISYLGGTAPGSHSLQVPAQERSVAWPELSGR